MNLTKSIWVVDSPNSALAIAARSRAKFQEFDILYSADYLSPKRLCVELQKRGPAKILFSWRQAFLESSKLAITAKLIEDIRKESSLGILVPDYVGLSASNFSIECEMIKLADYYLVTNLDLFRKYSNLFEFKPPAGILHDFPDTDLIDLLIAQNKYSDANSAIWVGNSKWGARQGFHDHKGFYKVILPLREILRKHNHCFSLEIIDSATKRIPQQELLKRMSRSGYILQASASEGTGLPLLEGIAMGLTPISTRVGIAEEILSGALQENLVMGTPEAFHHALHANQVSPVTDRKSLQILYKEYLNMALQESAFRSEKTSYGATTHPDVLPQVKIGLEWAYRFSKNLLKAKGGNCV